MFKDYLTVEGERLLAKAVSGTATITFTRMELGDGIPGNIKNTTELANSKMTLDIYSVAVTGDNAVQITSILESKAIASGFYFREKGIYATDGVEEVLMIYGTNSLPEYIESIDNAVFQRQIRTVVAVTNEELATIELQGGMYATGEQMQEGLEETTQEILSAISNIKLDGDWAKYSQAESILSLLDNFVKAYTVLRAGKLDNLDALVSSRAPAGTALSNAVWTNARAAAIDTINANAARLTAARAAAIDNLDTKISSRAPASTALSNGVWTDYRASYLDYLVNGAFGLPAIANKLKRGISLNKLYSNTVRHTGVDEISVFNISGSGRLEGVYAYSNASSANGSNISQLRIIIDGVEIYRAQSDRSRDIYRGILRADFMESGDYYWRCYFPKMSLPVSGDPFVAATTSNGVISDKFGIVLVPEPIRFESSINILVYHLWQDQTAYTQVSYGVVMD